MVEWADREEDDLFPEVEPELQLEIIKELRERLAPLSTQRDARMLDPYFANQVGTVSATVYTMFFDTDVAFNVWLQTYISTLVNGWLSGLDL